MDVAAAFQALWPSLARLRDYMRHGIVEQLRQSESFGGEDMTPVFDAHREFGRVEPYLSESTQERVRTLFSDAETELNAFLDLARRRAETSASDESRRRQLEEEAIRQLDRARTAVVNGIDLIAADGLAGADNGGRVLNRWVTDHHVTSGITGPIEVFFSYAHEDEELMDAVRRQLIVHERNGLIEKWHDREIPAGADWKEQIDDRIRRASVILLLVSPHFIESRYCYEIEMGIALKRHSEGKAVVIPVILRPTDWHYSPLGALQALPQDGRPVSRWEDLDEACLDVGRGVMQVVDQIRQAQGRGLT